MKYRFSVIGLGRVGSAMLVLLEQAGHTPVWVVTSRSTKGPIPACESIPDDPLGTEVVFIAVPDSAINLTAETIAQNWGDDCKGIVFYHFSGLFSSDLLSPLKSRGGDVGSLHPLQSIMDMSRAKRAIQESLFTIEGTRRSVVIAEDIISSIGSTLMNISKEDKTLYHTAAVIASNYLVSLISQATELMETIGLGTEHLLPLIKGTVSNVQSHGKSALTGPILRGDWTTVKNHINMLHERFPDIVSSYKALGEYTARIAGQKWHEDVEAEENVLDIHSMIKKVATLKKRGVRVVFTNGCFDIIHGGHISYLHEARYLGDCLVVGLNSDASVRRIKGPDRPVNNQYSRAKVLSSLRGVDYLCLFDDDTPYELIDKIRPDVLVKGGDWDVDDIVGADIVRSYGGEVYTISFKPGYSTTGIIEKIKGS